MEPNDFFDPTGHDPKTVERIQNHIRLRIAVDYEKVAKKVAAAREFDRRIILISGSYDIIHEGHMLYLFAGKSCPDDFVIAGLDSDEKVKLRKKKGPHDLRPFFNQNVRMLQLSFLLPIDLVTLKDVSHTKWELIKLIQPDILQATQETYSQEEKDALLEWCGQVIVQTPFATQGTSAHLRRMMLGGAQELAERIQEKLPNVVNTSLQEMLGKE